MPTVTGSRVQRRHLRLILRQRKATCQSQGQVVVGLLATPLWPHQVLLLQDMILQLQATRPLHRQRSRQSPGTQGRILTQALLQRKQDSRCVALVPPMCLLRCPLPVWVVAGQMTTSIPGVTSSKTWSPRGTENGWLVLEMTKKTVSAGLNRSTLRLVNCEVTALILRRRAAAST